MKTNENTKQVKKTLDVSFFVFLYMVNEYIWYITVWKVSQSFVNEYIRYITVWTVSQSFVNLYTSPVITVNVNEERGDKGS